MKREIVRNILRVTGLTALRWRFLSQKLYCFNYHRIGDTRETQFDRGIFSCTQEILASHVAIISERFDVITAEDLVTIRSQRSTRPLAMITFDDGYRDNYTLAFPVLKRHGISATFFVPTGFVENRQIPWWDEIAWLVRNASADAIRIADSDIVHPVGRSATDISIMHILQIVRRRPAAMSAQLQEIRNACQVPLDQRMPIESLFMTWAQVREMHNAGMTIGSHTHTHPILSTLHLQGQREELALSKKILEEKLGTSVRTIAYPVGSSSAYTQETCRLAKDVGYELGFSFRRHTNRLPLERPYEIGRFAVDGNMTLRRFRSLVAFPSI